MSPASPETRAEAEAEEAESTRNSPRGGGAAYDEGYFPRHQVEDSFVAEFPIFHTLVVQLEDKDPGVRGAACWSLGQLRYRPVIRKLGRILGKDEDSLVRMQAAQSLARIRSAASAQALIRGLKDPDELVRDACILGLGNLGDVQGLFPLEDLLSRTPEEAEDLRRRLSWAVGRLKALEAPAQRPDRRRGGVSKKISRALDRLHRSPRDGIAHNNLAVAYFHAAEYQLAVRHCLLAKELGARVEWLWSELVRTGCDPSRAEISREDQAFLGEDGASLHLEREPQRSDLGNRGEEGRGSRRSSPEGASAPSGRPPQPRRALVAPRVAPDSVEDEETAEEDAPGSPVAAAPDSASSPAPEAGGATGDPSGVVGVVRDPGAEVPEVSAPAPAPAASPSPEPADGGEAPPGGAEAVAAPEEKTDGKGEGAGSEGGRRRKKRRRGKKRRGRS